LGFFSVMFLLFKNKFNGCDGRVTYLTEMMFLKTGAKVEGPKR